jgi:hypothetical protein
MSQYFLPIERQGILLSWQQGNFAGAEIWMRSHQGLPKYRVLSSLANLFTQVANLEADRVLARIARTWMSSRDIRELVDELLLSQWRSHPALDHKNRYDVIWENTFLVFLYTRTHNYTGAFFQLSQTLERLLFERYVKEEWLRRGVIIIPKEKERYAHNYTPSFQELLGGWCQRDGIKETSSWYRLIDGIRILRNQVTHEGKSISEKDILELWTRNGITMTDSMEAVFLPLYKVCEKLTWKAPQQSLLGCIYDWALNILRTDVN